MKRKAGLSLFLIIFAGVILAIVNIALGGVPSQTDENSDFVDDPMSSPVPTIENTNADEPPPPPTPGPEPTPIPESYEGAIPVYTIEEAIDYTILLDKDWAVRDEALTREDFLDTDKFIIEQYDTWQEASDLYGFGVRDDEWASKPVWVIIVKGDVVVNTMKGPEESNGVTYIFSKETGYLLSMANGASEKEQ